mgnify:CR=1 FL=1
MPLDVAENIEFTPLRQALEETWAWLRATPRYLEPQPFRGEEHLRENRPIPIWLKVIWKFDDVTRSSAVRGFITPRLRRLLRRRRDRDPSLSVS